MKKFFLTSITMLLCTFSIFAQLKPVKEKPQTLKLRNDTLPQYRRPAPTPPAPVVIPPALQLYNVEATAIQTSPGVFSFTITCGIRNDSTAAVPLDKLLLQGYTVNQADQHKPMTNLLAYNPAGGAAVGVAPNMLQPGARTKTAFKCTNVTMDLTKNPLYALTLKFLPNPAHPLVPFSRIDVPITIQPTSN